MIRDKVLRHPDREAIIEALNSGESIRSIEARLKKKYPKNHRLQLSSVTLQKFRKTRLGLEGQVLKDIQEVAGQDISKQNELEKQALLASTNAYNKKLNEIADTKLDVARRILELDKVIASRIEYWYNAVANGEESAIKGDRELRQFMDRQMALLGQYKKFVEGMADRTVDYNVNINILNDQVTVIRDVIMTCMAELDPDAALKFMEKVNSKLGGLVYAQKAVNVIQQPQKVILENLQEAEIVPSNSLIGINNEKV